MDKLAVVFLLLVACAATTYAGLGKKKLTEKFPFPDKCDGILCASPDCSHQYQYIPPGECCPKCHPKKLNCLNIQCLAVACNPGEKQVQRPGECCPRCVENHYQQDLDDVSAQLRRAFFGRKRPFYCRRVRCIRPTCTGGKVPTFTSGRCCSVCRPTTSGMCSLPPVTGFCRAYFRRYYYDNSTKQCKRFVYGGCGGNKNNFRTMRACQIKCGGQEDAE